MGRQGGKGACGWVDLIALDPQNLGLVDAGGSGELLLCRVALLAQLADCRKVGVEGISACDRIADRAHIEP